MDARPTPLSARFARPPLRFAGRLRDAWWRPAVWLLLTGLSASALCASRTPSSVFAGVLHARGPHGVYTEIVFAPHRLVARVHAPHLCVLRARLVHGDPHTNRYAIEPPQGGRFCDELVDGEIVVHPRSPNEVIAEFRSARMDWSGRFRHDVRPR